MMSQFTEEISTSLDVSTSTVELSVDFETEKSPSQLLLAILPECESEIRESQVVTQIRYSEQSQPCPLPLVNAEPWAVLYNLQTGSSIYLSKNQFTVGRSQSSDFVLEKSTLGRLHANCSRNHFRILRLMCKDGNFSVFIQNLSYDSGTFVNGNSLRRSDVRPLRDKNKISIVNSESKIFMFYDLENCQKLPNLPLEIKSNYIVGDMLGQGAFGKVYSVTKLSTSETMALKAMIFDPIKSVDPLKEASIMYTVRHVNIVRVHEIFASDNQLFIFMEYLPGGHLINYLNKRKSSLNESEAKYICFQLAHAVNALHDQNIVHRDIKPCNILIYHRNNDYPHVKLSDFGLSKVLNKTSDSFSTNKFYGTRAFAAPELSRFQVGQRISTIYYSRCDIWSLGLVFYYIFSRQLPFKSSSDALGGISRIQFDLLNFVPSDRWSAVSRDAKLLIRLMLQVDYRIRLSAKRVLQNRYFNNDTNLIDRYSTMYISSMKKQHRSIDGGHENEPSAKKKYS